MILNRKDKKFFLLNSNAPVEFLSPCNLPIEFKIKYNKKFIIHKKKWGQREFV